MEEPTGPLTAEERKYYERYINGEVSIDTVLRLDNAYQDLKRQHDENLCRWQVSEQKFVTEREAKVLAAIGALETILAKHYGVCHIAGQLETLEGKFQHKIVVRIECFRILIKAVQDAQKFCFMHAELSKDHESVMLHYSEMADKMTDALTNTASWMIS